MYKSKDSEKKSVANVHGIGFCGLLTIAFIVLKLIGKITWSWVWVLAPTWMPAAFALLAIIITFVVAFIINH